MAQAAKEANVIMLRAIQGCERADGIYINTAGIGLFECEPVPQQVMAGDMIIASGQIGNHGIAIMSARENIEFTPPFESDAAPLNRLAQAAMRICPEVHAMRDPTRGGLAQSLCEWSCSDIDIAVYDSKIPQKVSVSSACELLGLDIMQIANEGVMLFAVPRDYAEAVVQALRKERYGEHACIIGEAIKGTGNVYAVSELGTKRIIRMPVGELLPSMLTALNILRLTSVLNTVRRKEILRRCFKAKYRCGFY